MKSLSSLFNKVPFGKKLRILSFVTSILILITAVIVLSKVYSIQESNSNVINDIKSVEKVKDLQLAVSQIWQFCTDASLTQNTAVLDSDVKKNYESALQSIIYLDSTKFGVVNSAFNSDDLKSELSKMHEIGVRMVKSYAISKEEGDREMAHFDEACDKIITDLNKLSAETSKLSNGIITENNERIDGTILATIIGTILLLLIILPPLLFITKYADGFFTKLGVLIEEASHGVFMNRFSNMQFEDDLGELAWRYNEMIDQIEAFLKETSTSIEYAAQKKYFRIPLSTGLQGMFVTGSESVKKSIGLQKKFIDEIEEQSAYLTRSVNEILHQMEKFAEGDLTVSVQAEKTNDEIAQLFNGFNKVVQNIKLIISSVIDSVEATASASSQISSSSEEMAAGAQEQSSQTTEMASSIEEMTKTIFESTKITASAAEIAKKSGEIAKDGGNIVTQTIDGMNRIALVVKQSAETVETLGQNSDKIGEIVQVINDIADQTNLLALNAAIEAARAGEQGRGFAVVADEVRKLAERTTKATKEIADMIKKIQTDTAGAVQSIKSGTVEVERGKSLADQAGHSLKEIIDHADQVVSMVTQVAHVSEEQSTTAEVISQNIEGISNVASESAQGIQQIASAAEDLNRLTVNLQELVSKFNMGTGSRAKPAKYLV